MIVTADGQQHTAAPSPAAMTALLAEEGNRRVLAVLTYLNA
jgi:hypothetical protein